MMLPTRRMLRALAGLPVVLALAVAVPDVASASSQVPQSQRQVTVMTRNLYLGADLTGIVAATSPTAAFTAMAQVAGTVEFSQPAKRMAGVADEITAAHPDVVGLQEVSTWNIVGRNPLNGEQIVPAANYDFLALLLADLAANGTPYHVVVAQKNFDSAVQLPAAVQALATFTDNDVLIARNATSMSQLQVLGTGKAHFDAQLVIPVASLGTSINFDRGYVWADLQTRGKVWRVVNTHPEAYAPSELGLPGSDVNGPQMQELADTVETSLPTVVLGDLNSAYGETTRPGYAVMIGAGYSDTWLALGNPDTDYTCCRNETLSGGTLHSRIDHVLGRGLVNPKSATHVGVDPFDATPPMWPSDHAGVVTTLSIGKE
ncbi:MAG TPA: endonuclease/exonuclease/phosphatase family protein [Mycobacteriales bacterium]|jgi:endonuclease/exonuclease/phosphatase family metal-dependent hydrolase|nr:endonuclease/exonuclease/phosphatase family protein [Mycobacteriales bacterium]